MKTKRPYAHVLPLAQRIVTNLAPTCERIELAGSLRRRCARVGDIEIVAVPRPLRNLFGQPTDSTELDDLLRTWRTTGHITLTKEGQKYKQFHFNSTAGRQFTVDLFLQPDPATWGVNFLIRTGGAEFARWMVTPRDKGGAMPDEYRVRDARVWAGPECLETPEEEDVFRLWELPFIAPEKRNEIPLEVPA